MANTIMTIVVIISIKTNPTTLELFPASPKNTRERERESHLTYLGQQAVATS